MYNIKEIQRCQMELLREFKRVCTANDIIYFLAYGTCLGGVRHGGFIPWDDDIDVCVPIEDYKKLSSCLNEFNQGYFFQTHETDPEYGLMIGRLRNCNTTLIENFESHRDMNHGVFIDIYPIYNTPKDGFSLKRMVMIASLCRLLLYKEAPRNHGVLLKIGSNFLLKILPGKIKSALINRCKNFIFQHPVTGHYSTLYGNESFMVFSHDLLFPTHTIQFEDSLEPVPASEKEYLTITYGDYMTLPPAEERKPHHDYKFMDLNNSYIKYKGIHYCCGA